MSIEAPHTNEQNEDVSTTLHMQYALIERALEEGAEVTERHVLEWINQYAEGFRAAVRANPRLVTLYQSDPEHVLETIEAELYQTQQDR